MGCAVVVHVERGVIGLWVQDVNRDHRGFCHNTEVIAYASRKKCFTLSLVADVRVGTLGPEGVISGVINHGPLAAAVPTGHD